MAIEGSPLLRIELLESDLEELEQALAEVKEGNSRGNLPQLGAALCHLEYHLQAAMNQLQQASKFFKPEDFRRFIYRVHGEQT